MTTASKHTINAIEEKINVVATDVAFMAQRIAEAEAQMADALAVHESLVPEHAARVAELEALQADLATLTVAGTDVEPEPHKPAGAKMLEYPSPSPDAVSRCLRCGCEVFDAGMHGWEHD